MSDKLKVPKVPDKTYYTLSRESYNRERLDRLLKSGKPIQTDQNSSWFVEEVKRDFDTGLDAVVVSQGIKNSKGKWIKTKSPKNVIIAFAGTDPVNQLRQDVIKADAGNVVLGLNPETGINYIVEKNTKDPSKTLAKYVGTPSQEAMLATGKYKLITKTSQFDQADQLVNKIKKKYQGTSTVISTTGHSLGGAEAEYSAVNNDIYAVAFNNPSIVKLHSKEKQKEINNGVYEPYIRSFINPDDMVGAGWWNEYERHNGTTIFTKDPSIARAMREERMSGRPSSVIGKNTAYFLLTTVFRNPDTHMISKKNFAFDNDGNISSINGDDLIYVKGWDAVLPAEVVGGSEAIKVTPSSARKLSEKVQHMVEDLQKIKKEAQNAYQEHDEKISELKVDLYGQVGHGFYDLLNEQDVNNALEEIALSLDKGPIFYDVKTEQTYIDALNNAIRDLDDIGSFLNEIANKFEEKDNLLANWLRR